MNSQYPEGYQYTTSGLRRHRFSFLWGGRAKFHEILEQQLRACKLDPEVGPLFQRRRVIVRD